MKIAIIGGRRSAPTMTLPMKKNVPNPGHKDWVLVTCPVCGAECWESELARMAKKLQPDLRAACTECALRGAAEKDGDSK